MRRSHPQPYQARQRSHRQARRWKCATCKATVTRADHNRPLGEMRIELAQAVQVLKMLLEGMSIRACERITGMKRTTRFATWF